MNKLFPITTLSLLIAACGGVDSAQAMELSKVSSSSKESTAINPQSTIAHDAINFSLKFSDPNSPWTVGYADYPGDAQDIYDLSSKTSELPQPLHNHSGLNIAGTNRSDDLFMFAEQRLSDLESNQDYEATLTLTFATNAPHGCFGVGGAPGESVYIKAGIEQIRPKSEWSGAGYYQMNIDKGNQKIPGKRVKTLGDFANSQECYDTESDYEIKTVTTELPIEFTSTEDGHAWAIVATDSGFESRTSIWYINLEIDIKKR